MVDEKGALRIERIYHTKGIENRFEEQLRWQNKHYDEMYKQATESLTTSWLPRFGQRSSRADILWRVANMVLEDYAKKNDLQSMSQTYFHQALYIHELGKDCHYLLKLAHEMELRNYASTSVVTSVGMLAANDSCKNCIERHDQRLAIQEATQLQPLPCAECTFKLNESAPTGWCRCLYVPYAD